MEAFFCDKPDAPSTWVHGFTALRADDIKRIWEGHLAMGATYECALATLECCKGLGGNGCFVAGNRLLMP